MNEEIQALQQQLYETTLKLHKLQAQVQGDPVPDYVFDTLEGSVTLKELFGNKNKLLIIHNMGQGCRYCTLWADGFNGLLAHLESAMSVVLVSRDSPETQRAFANSRGWRFRLASHGGNGYIKEQSVVPDSHNMPGAVVYELRDGEIYRLNHGVFGPGDLYCSMLNLLALAGIGEENWTPQYRYWQKPEKMDDGGNNVVD